MSMYEEKLVSVVVPVYNVEKYLVRCVDSILNQKYENLEIILVDDGSTDNSGALCDEQKIRSDKIKVVHQRNMGLSGARNTGIDVSTGEFICFIDSDDYVNPDYVRYLYNICVSNNCDIGICGFVTTEKSDYSYSVNMDSKVDLFTAGELLDLFYSDMHVPIVAAWNKIYKRECIGDIRYDVGRIHEDEGATFRFLYNAQKIAYSLEPLYYYFSREDSITGNGYSIKNLDILKAYENRLEFYKEQSEIELYERECQFYLSEILTNYYKVYYKLGRDKELLNELKVKYREGYRKAHKSEWNLSRRALYLICRFWPLLYGLVKFK